jgi:hypothetical protein
MRNSAGKAAALVAVLAVSTACGQIGQPSSPTPGGVGITPVPLNPSVSPAGTCLSFTQLTPVDMQVTKLIDRMDKVQGQEDFVSVIDELTTGFKGAQADLAQVPTSTTDPDVVKARGLLEQVIGAYVSGLPDLAEGYQKADQSLLLNATVKLDAANKVFIDQYIPAVYSASGCF